MPLPPQVSFEFFPPATPKMEATLWRAIQALAPLAPRFVSVTYGADGSTRDRTHRIVRRIKAETELTCAPHLTCVGASRDEVLELAQTYRDDGIAHLVALRGDPPAGADAYSPREDGYAYAADLVAGLGSLGKFDISVAAYPEVHPEAPSPEFDLDNLKRKIDAGATRAITQFFFEPDVFLRFRDRCAASGIDVAIVPGLLPIVNFTRMLRFAESCGATVPGWLHERFANLQEDAQAQHVEAARTAIDLVGKLHRHGVDEIHFYTLNRAELVVEVCESLGITPAPDAPAPADG